MSWKETENVDEEIKKYDISCRGKGYSACLAYPLTEQRNI